MNTWLKRKKTFADFYSYEDIKYEGDKSIVTVYCSDIIGQIQNMCVMRDLDYENCTKKVGIDGGTVSLKLFFHCLMMRILVMRGPVPKVIQVERKLSLLTQH